jgi:hypothetical protein
MQSARSIGLTKAACLAAVPAFGTDVAPSEGAAFPRASLAHASG